MGGGARAPVEEVEDAIRPGGLAPTKAVPDQADPGEAPRRRRPGVAGGRAARGGARLPLRPARRGPQDRGLRAPLLVRPPDVPVDTHVYRVGTRLGLFRPGARLERGARRDAAAHARRRRVRGPRAADPPRPAHLRRRATRAARSARCGACAPRAAAAWRPHERLRAPAPRRRPRRPVPPGHRGAEGPHGRDRHLPRHRRRALPPAHDPPVRRARGPRVLPGGADPALPPALRRVREGRRLRALEAPAAERGDLVRRRAGSAPAAAPQPRRSSPSRRWRSRSCSCCRPTSSGRRSRCSPTTWRCSSRSSRWSGSIRPGGPLSPGAFAVACLAICAAVLTRQSFVWLAPVAAAFLLLAPVPLGRKLAGLGAGGRGPGPAGRRLCSCGRPRCRRARTRDRAGSAATSPAEAASRSARSGSRSPCSAPTPRCSTGRALPGTPGGWPPGRRSSGARGRSSAGPRW